MEIEISKELIGYLAEKMLELSDDKSEFELWLETIDDDTFTEIWEALADEYSLKELNEIYESDDYDDVIIAFKEKAVEIIIEKIEYYLSILKGCR